MYAENDYFVRSETNIATWLLTITGSTLGHMLFFAVIFFFPKWDQAEKYQPTIIDIDLVSVSEQTIEPFDELEHPVMDEQPEIDETIPEDQSNNSYDQSINTYDQPETQSIQPETNYEQKQFQPLAPISAPKTFKPLKPKPKIIKPEYKLDPIPEPEPVITPPPKPVQPPEKKEIKPIEKAPEKTQPETVQPARPKIKRSLKKQTIKKEQVTHHKKQKRLSDRFAQLRQKVRIDEAQKRILQVGEPKSTVELMDIYNAEVMSKIRKNWAVSFQMIGGFNTNLRATLVINIQRNGYIQTDMWFEKKSGNEYFDECVLKAVKKSNPLPKLPNAYLRPLYGPIGLNFTPEGLK